jgi:large subunit ribosomal protein L35
MKKSHLKHKPKSSVKKRFTVTKTGKVLRRSPGLRHLKRNKTKKQLRRLKQKRNVSPAFAKKVKKILGLK